MHNIGHRAARQLCTRLLPFVFAMAPGAASSQATPDITAGIGFTRIPMGRQWGGGINAGTVALSLGTRVSGRVGIAVTGRALLISVGRTAIPECAPVQLPDPARCTEYKTPDALGGVSASVFTTSADHRFRALASFGVLNAWGMRGSPDSASPLAEIGIDYRLLPRTRMAPVLGLSVARTSRALGGARTFVLPAIGLAF